MTISIHSFCRMLPALLVISFCVETNAGTATSKTTLCGAKDVVCVTLDRTKAKLEVTIAQDWHINAHEALDEFLIPTELFAGGAPSADTTYPPPAIKSLSFTNKPLALYEGTFLLQAPLPDSPENASSITFTFQACSENTCLPPQDLVFETP